MNSKLTLKLDSEAIENAKSYAKKNHVSLSKMVEDYFIILTDEKEPKDQRISPLVKEMSGIIDLENDFDYKDAYSTFLIEKYK